MSMHLLEKKIVKNNLFFVIPSWGDLLGFPILGNYANHNISKISQDLVIFLGGTECANNGFHVMIYF